MSPLGPTRALRASLAGGALVVMATALGLLLVVRQRELREARDRDAAEVARYLQAQGESRTELMEALLLAIRGDRVMENAFRGRDAERLLELARPLYDTLRVRNTITHLYFITPDRRAFLRVHEPGRSGDSLTSAILAEAATEARTVSGIEGGPVRGTPAWRVVSPWMDDGELLGYVSLGTGLNRAAGSLRDALDLHGFVVLSKEGIVRAAYEEDERAAGRTPHWDRYPGVVLVDGTLDTPPPELEERFRTPTTPGAPGVVSAELMGRTHQGQAFPLMDFSGRPVGEIVFLRDRSRLLAGFNQAALGFAGVFALVALAIWLGLRRTLAKHIVRPLAELVRVTEAAGRGDLAETMLAQRHDEMGDLGRAVNLMIGELRAAQEERTSRIVDAAQDAVVTADANGIITGWNAAAQTIFGWTRREAIGMTLTEAVIPESDHAAHLRGMLRQREGGASKMLNRRVEVTARRRNGEHFPAELTVTKVESTAGPTYAAFIRDITERRAAEQALRSTEDRFRRLLETANVVPWEANSRTTRLTYVGPQAETLLGFRLSAWYEEGFWMRQLHPDDREHALLRISAAANATEAAEFEYRMIKSDGSVVWVRDIVAADVTSEGPVLRGFRFDVTERRRLEEELLQSRKMEAVGRLAGGIAHDFNNLLTAIIGYASLVETSIPEGSQPRADVAEIRRAADQAADLTQQLLAFARKQVIRPRALIVDDLVRRLEKMMARLLVEDVTVVTRVASGDAAVWVDPSSLEQALLNLILNARDAMPRGGHAVTLHRGRRGGRGAGRGRERRARDLRDDHGGRHRHRDGRLRPRARVRAVLHYPEGGHRARALDNVRRRAAGARLHRGGQRPRPGLGVPGAAPPRARHPERGWPGAHGSPGARGGRDDPRG